MAVLQTYFAGTFGGRTKTPALEDGAVSRKPGLQNPTISSWGWGKNPDLYATWWGGGYGCGRRLPPRLRFRRVPHLPLYLLVPAVLRLV